jgi:lysyl-tRNA synthetase class I
MRPYLYFDGLIKLSQEMRGDEVVHVGVRPYGFHAGNAIALCAYPFLLCKYLRSLGKEPRIRLVVSINDWEQDELDGPDPRQYRFNIHPKESSLQYLPDQRGCCGSSVEHWQPIIERCVGRLKDSYPLVDIRYVRNSELIKYPLCQELLVETIRNPHAQLAIFSEHSGLPVLPEPVSFAGAVCPKCYTTHGCTAVTNADVIRHECAKCGSVSEGAVSDFKFWWYHKPMLLARLGIFDIDITLSGGDHFTEGDFNIRRAFISNFAPSIQEPKMLFTPTILAEDGQKMSKSRHNVRFANIANLIRDADGFIGEEMIARGDLILDDDDETNYHPVF